jgi:hypothetical protein
VIAGDSEPRPTISWAEARAAMEEILLAGRDDAGQWSLSFAESRPDAPWAHDTLAAAADHIAWVASAVLTGQMPGGEATPAPPAPLPAEAAESLFAEPSFADPLRRLASATLGARAIRCADCLGGARPSRDVDWDDLRIALEAFIHVRDVHEDGRIDLQVGTLSSSLPPFGQCDPDVAAAAHAIIRRISIRSAAVQETIGRALRDELMRFESFPREILQRKLNETVPGMVLSDAVVLASVAEVVVPILDLHGLRCSDCVLYLSRRRP